MSTSFSWEHLENSWLHITLDGRQGNVRKTMEDAAIISTFILHETRYHAFCVLDGHAGSEPVTFLTAHFVPELFQQMQKLKTVTNVTVDKAITKTFVYLNERLRAECPASQRSGSTLSMLLIREFPFSAWTANVGDSSILGCSTDHSKSKRLSVDHKPTLLREKKRVLSHQLEICDQGYVCNEKGSGLAMTRAMGDFEMGKGVLAQPTVRHVDVAAYRNIMLASDGFWDVVAIKKAPALIAQCKTATELNNHRHKKYDQHDNTTILVICILKDPPSGPVKQRDGILLQRVFGPT